MPQSALAYLDITAPLGAIQATATGFQFNFIAAYRDTVTGSKTILSGIQATTLDADSPAQINAKLKAAIVAFGVPYGFASVTVVLVPAFNTL